MFFKALKKENEDLKNKNEDLKNKNEDLKNKNEDISKELETLINVKRENLRLHCFLGEIPIQSLDLNARYRNPNADSFLHNRSIIQIPKGKFQIIMLNKDGEVVGSIDNGLFDTENEVLNYMNNKGYIKLKENL